VNRRRFGPAAETVAVCALGIAAIYLALVPFSLAAERPPAPDLVFCLVAAWTIRRPAEAPLWAVLALGLAADLFLSRPMGLGALGLLLVAEALRGNAGSLRAGPFAAEWLTVAGLAAAVALCGHAALELAFAASPGLGPLLLQAAATGLAYPAVVGLLALGLGLRAARGGGGRRRPGRLP
jgi:rod shape-determining protein MreD